MEIDAAGEGLAYAIAKATRILCLSEETMNRTSGLHNVR